MPKRNARPCHTPGCLGLSTTSYCLRCRAFHRQQRGPAPYDNPRWRACSRAFLRVHPVCANKECSRPATEAHHIDGLGPTGSRGYDWTNLLPVCKAHHSQLTVAMLGLSSPHRG
jgi:hypothetical protein